jgi:hypothetical protein
MSEILVLQAVLMPYFTHFPAAGGLPISEALNLHRDDHADGTVPVRQGKRANAARYVDLASPIAAMADKVDGDTKPGARLFRAHLTP